ncbi:chemotaxis response regulator CheB, partial [Variovorax sp. GrIS 2.14]|uniref:chemotaxis protein CheB n=1 Tax=Variovorax sp. GrIS 2.14 TaxID=3071709 RepID=UPI0038F75A76
VPSADHLFASAAAVYGLRVVGVLLSGRSHDGTQGLEDIEAAGGVGIVQLPETAGSAGMPYSAMRNDHPNYCLPVPQIAALLGRLPLTHSDVPSAA